MSQFTYYLIFTILQSIAHTRTNEFIAWLTIDNRDFGVGVKEGIYWWVPCLGSSLWGCRHRIILMILKLFFGFIYQVLLQEFFASFNDLDLKVIAGTFFAIVTRFLQLTSKFFTFILLTSVFWTNLGFLSWLNRTQNFIIIFRQFKNSFFDLLLQQRTQNFIVFRWFKAFFFGPSFMAEQEDSKLELGCCYYLQMIKQCCEVFLGGMLLWRCIFFNLYFSSWRLTMMVCRARFFC